MKIALEKKILGIIIILSAFIFLVSFGTLYAQTHIIEGTACGCTLPIPLLIPTFSSFGVIIGALVYYFIGYSKQKEYIPRNISKKLESYNKIYTKNKLDPKIFLNLLDNKEKQILESIIKNGGEISQAKLSSLFGKVVTFRAIESLKRKGIVKKEKYGKTNKIILEDLYKDAFLK
jgi:predicted histidine transporter YuiF (NhaC family)